MKIKPTKLEFKLSFFLPASLFCFFLMQALTLTAQQVQNAQGKDEYLVRLESMPEYPGGIEGLLHFLKKNVHYPPKARKKGIEGIVVVQFIVERDGSISNPEVVKSVGGGCDEAALAAFEKMPKWNPGLKQGGEPVRVQHKMPISFHLK